jgi:hypothetical protein
VVPTPGKQSGVASGTCSLRRGACHGSTEPLTQWIKDLFRLYTETRPKEGNEPHHKWVLVNGKPVVPLLPKGDFPVQRHHWNVERTSDLADPLSPLRPRF